MAIEDKLIGSWANQDRRSLLDLATGGRAKHGGTGKYRGEPGAISPLSEVIPNLWGKVKEAGIRQQSELSREIFPGHGVTGSDIMGLATGSAGLITKVSSFKNMERTLPALEETLQWLKGYSPSSPLIKKFANLHKKISGYIHGDARAAKSVNVHSHYKGNKKAAEKALEKSDKKVADRLNKEYDDIVGSITSEGEKNVITGYRTKSLSQEAGKKTAARSSDDILEKELREQRRTEIEMQRMGSRRKY